MLHHSLPPMRPSPDDEFAAFHPSATDVVDGTIPLVDLHIDFA